MDELGDIEARRAACAANLRRAFGAPVGGEPPAFAVLLQRLAAKADERAEVRSAAPALAGSPGAAPRAVPRAVLGAAWPRPLADT